MLNNIREITCDENEVPRMEGNCQAVQEAFEKTTGFKVVEVCVVGGGLGKMVFEIHLTRSEQLPFSLFDVNRCFLITEEEGMNLIAKVTRGE